MMSPASPEQFTALLLENHDGHISPSIRTLSSQALPPGDVTVAVSHSTVNYKDGLILKGLGNLVRTYPHVPGVDFAGVVENSDSPRFQPGDEVILTGWRVGESQWGGYATRARVRADWLVPLPSGLTPRRAMALGTAGLTAMLAVMTLEEHGLVAPSPDAEVLVTGAAGGLGSVAVALLSRLGYRVVAATGRREAAEEMLRRLGASRIVDRQDFLVPRKGPLNSEQWAAAIDSVGGEVLATVLASLRRRGLCAATGNAGGSTLATTVIPFLLRGICLLGVDSVMCPLERRTHAWERLAREMPADLLDSITSEIPLARIPEVGTRILEGRIMGRTVVDVRK